MPKEDYKAIKEKRRRNKLNQINRYHDKSSNDSLSKRNTDTNYWKKLKEKNIFIELEVSSPKKELFTDKFVENKNADNYFYYFRFLFKNKKYYKVGITSRSLEERYGKDYNKIDKVLYCERIDGAIRIEKDIKEKFKNDIFPIAYLNGGGHTETFDIDVLELDL